MSSDVTDLHERERVFFDSQAAKAKADYLDPRILIRYARPGNLFPREFMHRLLGNVGGKTVLDVGCGEGQAALVLSKLGAYVTGIDLSAGTISVARERLAMNHTSAEFICGAMEEFAAEQKYDIVWVESLLHHVIHDLDHVMRSLVTHLKPAGTIIMCEPVNLLPALRRQRLKMGKTNGTPDERPLEDAEIAIIQRHVPELRMRHFRCLGRLDTFIYDQQYECASWTVRSAVRSLAIADALLSLPGTRRIAGVAVMWGAPHLCNDR